MTSFSQLQLFKELDDLGAITTPNRYHFLPFDMATSPAMFQEVVDIFISNLQLGRLKRPLAKDKAR